MSFIDWLLGLFGINTLKDIPPEERDRKLEKIGEDAAAKAMRKARDEEAAKEIINKAKEKK